MSKPLGVGIIGAGPVTQAIHLPTLATLGDRLQVVHIMDVNAEVGALVASRTGARSTTSIQTLLEDPEVDVVAICSPGQFHAAQVEATTAAGKRGILCEKP
ncbi:MAG TPA: Gfo/Idh/MocA family oxidoreductase, partial [Terrimicrobiaceae bacterium]|nr:Gfo/Idh/MocA family oxidoreductase [Terrimicrobiaceae bacterium]